jgi:DNA-directed RNA polymerase specialized sigma24 family protein
MHRKMPRPLRVHYSLSDADLNQVRRKVDLVAGRLARRYGLAWDQREDLSQDLLVDLIARLKSFDPARGTFAAFAEIVIAHQASTLMKRVWRERILFAASLDGLVGDDEASTLGESIPESDGYLAFYGRRTEWSAEIELRLDLERALSFFAVSDLSLCAQLVDQSPHELREKGMGARATVYRRIEKARLQLLALGISAA